MEQLLAGTAVGRLARWVIEAATGKPRGCGQRRERLNRLMPYGKATRRT